MNDLIQTLAEQVTDAAAPLIAARITAEIEQTLKNREFCYSEKEAAAMLNLGTAKLAEYRKRGEISCVVVIPQNKSGDGGRFVYKPEHIESFLRRREVLAVGEKRGNISEFPKREAA